MKTEITFSWFCSKHDSRAECDQLSCCKMLNQINALKNNLKMLIFIFVNL